MGSDAVDVWSAPLDCGADAVAQYSRLLSADEMARANAFRFPHLRSAYIAGRGILRSLLAEYVPSRASELHFEYGPQGKPHLPAYAGLHFNVSHSGSLLVCAVSGVGAVGVDVEQVRELTDLEGIAKRFFAPEERRCVLLAKDQVRAFFECWTRKEAFIKATGEGLSRGLETFAVSVGPDRPACLTRIEEPVDDPGAWTLHSFEPAAGYLAAFAIRASVDSVSHRQWPGGE